MVSGERTSRKPDFGLCDSCCYQRLIHNTRGSVFSLCERWKDHPELFNKYPRVPIRECVGYKGKGN